MPSITCGHYLQMAFQKGESPPPAWTSGTYPEIRYIFLSKPLPINLSVPNKKKKTCFVKKTCITWIKIQQIQLRHNIYNFEFIWCLIITYNKGNNRRRSLLAVVKEHYKNVYRYGSRFMNGWSRSIHVLVVVFLFMVNDFSHEGWALQEHEHELQITR